MKSNRRSFLRNTTGMSLGLFSAEALIGGESTASKQLKREMSSGHAPMPFSNRFPRMLQEYYVDIFKQKEAEHTAKIYGLSSKAEALSYCRDVRTKILDCLGPFPDKSPLNAVTVSTLQREAYRIENVIFESRPGFKVTANLYLPQGKVSPSPAVLGTCGHTDDGKFHEVYQSCPGFG